VVDWRWSRQADVTSITVTLSGRVRYRTLTTPAGIAVDLWTVTDGGSRAAALDGGIASTLNLRQLTPAVARLDIGLREPARFKVFTRGDRVTVVVFPARQSAVPLPDSVAYTAMRVSTGSGRARVHVVTLDPQSGLTIQPALGGAAVAATEPTSMAAARLDAVAAINGNFYTEAGLPVGLVVIDGRVISAPIPRRPVFAITSRGRPWIGTTEFVGRVITDSGATIPISAVNRPPRWGGVALYTPEFGPLTFPQALVVIVRGDRVVGFSSGRPIIPTDGYALAAAQSQQFLLTSLRRGQPVKLDMVLSPDGIQHALQGGPRLVRGGQVTIPYEWEGFGPGFTYIRTARSAVGITRSDKVLFVTVDRRSPTSSGMNLPELASLMLGLGTRDAMNLDGGGSATLVVGGRVVSALPAGGERTVSSVLVALRRLADHAP
jgi:uncharacterized protein YigE (DUF2233 family)